MSLTDGKAHVTNKESMYIDWLQYDKQLKMIEPIIETSNNTPDRQRDREIGREKEKEDRENEMRINIRM